MPDPRTNLILGTRGSALALAQANEIRAQLRAKHPRLETEIKIIKTKGDSFQDLSLVAGGGKGLFTREIEQALLRNQIDVAIHSLKDLPTALPGGLVLAVVPKRADPRDVLILRSNSSINPYNCKDLSTDFGMLRELCQGAYIATSSLRRKSQLLAARSDLVIQEIRGNVETRLKKLAESETLSGLILAAAGLERLGAKIENSTLVADFLESPLPARKLNFDEMLSAVGQAALGLETRADDGRTESYLEVLNHYSTAQAVKAERAFLAALGGGCSVPIAAFGEVRDGKLTLRGAVFAANGQEKIAGNVTGNPDDAESVGAKLAEELKAKGAERLLS